MVDEAKLKEELEKMEAEYEPLLPVEKKLIVWSIGLGIGLLFILVWISYTFFPASRFFYPPKTNLQIKFLNIL